MSVNYHGRQTKKNTILFAFRTVIEIGSGSNVPEMVEKVFGNLTQTNSVSITD